jgi:hypothetical protein
MAKPSLQAALHNAGPANKSKANPPTEMARDTKVSKKLIVEIPAEAHYQIDKMRLEMRRGSLKELVTEALNDLFKKHNYPPIA